MSTRVLGLVGDVHTEDVRLAVALRALAAARVDLLLCAGDLSDGAGDLDRCCAMLAAAGALTVRGNHDRWLSAGQMRDVPDPTDLASLAPETRSYLAALPPARTLPTMLGELLLCHGMGDDDLSGFKPDHGPDLVHYNTALRALLAEKKYAIVVAGHTHKRMVRVLEGIVFLNAGTLHRRYDPGFAVVDLAERVAQFYDVDTERAEPAERLTW